MRGFLDLSALEPDGTLLVVDYESDRVALQAATSRSRLGAGLLDAAASSMRSRAFTHGAPAVEVAHCFLRTPPELLTPTAIDASRALASLELLLAEQPRRRFVPSAWNWSPTDPRQRGRWWSCPGRAGLARTTRR